MEHLGVVIIVPYAEGGPMKGLKSFLLVIRALHKSGKLDDAASRELTVTVERLHHDLHSGDRRNAEKHFQVLCDLMGNVLDR
mgnify:FL=1